MGNSGSLKIHDCNSLEQLQQKLWSIGTTDNGVLGVISGYNQSLVIKPMENLKKSLSLPSDLTTMQTWELIFPNHKHVFLTRRNKIRQVVSWWKAIQTDVWHRCGDEEYKQPHDILEKYDANALLWLLLDAVGAEAQMQDMFTENGVTPHTIVYEDFINNLEKTVYDLLDYIGVESKGVKIADPKNRKLADEVSEEWYRKFNEDFSGDWEVKFTK